MRNPDTLPLLACGLLAASACGGGEITWYKRFDSTSDAPAPTRPRWCADGTLWLGGASVATRDVSGGWKSVDVCGAFGVRDDGRRRGTDVACLPGGRLVALCGLEAQEGQVLVRFDADRKGTAIALPADGRLVLAPLPESVALVGETTLFVLEGDAVVSKGVHGLTEVQTAAGTAPDDVYATALSDSPTSGFENALFRFDGSAWTQVAQGNGHVELRGDAAYALGRGGRDDGFALRLRRGEAPVDLWATQPAVNRPVSPVAILPPDRLVYLAFFRTGFERENPSAYVWVGRAGASDLDYAGAAPLISGGGLYVAGSGGFVAAIDDGRFLAAGSTGLYEGIR